MSASIKDLIEYIKANYKREGDPDRVKALQEELQRVKPSLQKLELENNELKNAKPEDKPKELEDAKANLVTANARIQELEAKIASKSQSNNAASVAATTAAREAVDSTKIEEVTKLQNDVNKLSLENTKLQTENQAKTQELDKIKKQGAPMTPEQELKNLNNYQGMLKAFNSIEPPNSKYTPAFNNFISQLQNDKIFNGRLMKNLKIAYALFNDSIKDNISGNDLDAAVSEAKTKLAALQGLPGSSQQGTPGESGTHGQRGTPEESGTPGQRGTPEESGTTDEKAAQVKDVGKLKEEIKKYLTSNTELVDDLIAKANTIRVADQKDLDIIHKNLLRAQLNHKNIYNNVKTIESIVLKQKENVGGAQAQANGIMPAAGTFEEGKSIESSSAEFGDDEQRNEAEPKNSSIKKHVSPDPGAQISPSSKKDPVPEDDGENSNVIPQLPKEEDPQEDEEYKKLINKEYVASTASEFYREAKLGESFDSQVNLMGNKEYNEKINKVNYDVNLLNEIDIDLDVEEELYDIIEQMEEYNTKIKDLNEKYQLQNEGEKKGGGPKDYIKESMKLIKNSHDLIAKIIKEKSKTTKKNVNKKIKNITNKIRSK
jgi:hypothetical protein